tara:strand:- start:27 stop:194 length:168 start_codon:yes stop_codon:yes gene_type:complete
MTNLGKNWVSIAAIVVIGLLEWQALSMGIDGVLFGGAIGLIGGIAGYKVSIAKKR